MALQGVTPGTTTAGVHGCMHGKPSLLCLLLDLFAGSIIVGRYCKVEKAEEGVDFDIRQRSLAFAALKHTVCHQSVEWVTETLDEAGTDSEALLLGADEEDERLRSKDSIKRRQ